jgi:hypothetical protein
MALWFEYEMSPIGCVLNAWCPVGGIIWEIYKLEEVGPRWRKYAFEGYT